MMTTPLANVEMAKAWDGDEGEEWARDWQRYDRAVAPYQRALMDGAAIDENDRVLDIGCGNGESTRAAAHAAMSGSALGIDLSALMIERARELAALEGLENTKFQQADAQVHRFPSAAHDVVISRFGTMFFADAGAAFANIARALRPDGLLAMVAWRGPDANEWLRCIFAALAVGRELPVPPAGAAGPFGLADPDQVRDVLEHSGFDRIDLAAVDGPFWLGEDVDDAYHHFHTTGIVRGMTHGLGEDDRARALDALQQTMVEHETPHGVEFGSGVWLITARRLHRQ